MNGYFGNIIRASRGLQTNVINPYFKDDGLTINCDVKVNGTISGVVIPPERIITVAQSGAQFNNFPDALAYASTLNPTASNSVLIRGAPGTYLINDTLLWPGYVDFTGQNGNVIIAITDPNKNVIEFQPGVIVIERLMVSGALNACGYRLSVPGITQLLWCQVFGCNIGVCSDAPGSFIRIVTSGTPGTVGVLGCAENGGQLSVVTSLCKNATTGFTASNGGILRFIDTIVETTTTAFDFNDCVVEMSSCHVFDCGTALKCNTGADVVGTELNTFDCTTDLQTSNDIVRCTLGNSRIDTAKLVLADESLVSLNINDNQGRDKYFGGATVFEIQQIDLFGAGEVGTQVPQRAVIQDDGQNSPVGTALFFEASSQNRVIIPNSGTMVFNASYTIEFWLKPDANTSNILQYIIYKQGSFYIAYIKSTGQLRLYLWGLAFFTTSGIIANQRNYIAIVVDDVAKEAIFYINGGIANTVNYSGTLSNSANDVYMGNTSALNVFNYLNAIMGEINFWSKALNPTEVSARYNSGKGLENTDLVNLMAGYHCDEGSGTDLLDYSGNGNNGTHNSIQYVPGLINATTVSTVGVLAWHFDPDTNEELFMNVHPNSGYKVNEAIIPIVRWAPKTNAVGDVVWGFEYSIAGPGSAFPTTTVIEATTSAPGTALTHTETSLPSFTTSDYRNMILGRLFRNGSAPGDTYPDDVALLGFEFKYVKNKLGSDT